MNRLNVVILCIYFIFNVSIYSENLYFKIGTDSILYDWNEYIKTTESKNKKIVNENGILNGLFLEFSNFNKNEDFLYKATAKYYSGDIKYEGQDINNNLFDTRTSIIGYEIENGYAFLFSDIIPVVDFGGGIGIGYNSWNRHIHNGIAALNPGISHVEGYEESYSLLYLKMNTLFRVINNNNTNNLEIGFLYPIVFNEKIYFSKIGLNDFEVEPGKEFSPFLNINIIPRKDIKIELLYKTILISPSNMVKVGENNYCQPKSFSQTLEIRVGTIF